MGQRGKITRPWWECTVVELPKKFGMNGLWLTEIVDLRIRGYNNSEIEKRTGIARETVAKYLKRLREINADDRKIYVFLITAIFFRIGDKEFGTQEMYYK